MRLNAHKSTVLALAGFGFQTAFFALLAGWISPYAGDSGSLAGFLNMKSIAVCVAFLSAFVALFAVRDRAVSKRATITTTLVFPICAAIGTAFGLFGYASAGPVSFLVSFGMAGGQAVWMHVVCADEAIDDAAVFIGGTVFGVMVYFSLVWLPAPVPWAMGGLFAAPASAVLAVVLVATRKVPSEHMVEKTSYSPSLLKSSILPFVVVGAFGLCLRLMQTVLLAEYGQPGYMPSITRLMMIVGAVTAALMLGRNPSYKNPALACRAMLPVIGLLLLVIPVMPSIAIWIASSALYAVFVAL